MKRFVFLAAIARVLSPLVARQTVDAPRSLTAADYARAEKFLAASTTPLVYHAAGQPTWLADERFWYRVTTEKGTEAMLVDAAAATRSPCTLPECARPGGGRGRAAAGEGPTPRHRETTSQSPDGTQTAFIKDWNLWVRDVATGKETPLTTDGVKDFGYATDNAGWTKSDRPILLWAPDSKKIATFQQDQRDVGDMYLVKDRGRPPDARGLEVPAARRRARRHAAAGDHRRGRRAGRPPENAARSASFHALRPHRLPWRQLGRRRSGARIRRISPSCPPPAIIVRKTSRSPTSANGRDP